MPQEDQEEAELRHDEELGLVTGIEIVEKSLSVNLDRTFA
jgi:hypothetical protein